MITTTSDYKTNISASERNLKPKVEIYFDGEDSPPVVLGSDNIASIEYLEEAQAEGDNPLGAVSSNEIVIVLLNDDQAFNPDNPSGPYYGKLKPNVLVKPYYGLKINGSFEWISLGSFWTGYWDAESTTVYAEVICNDRLFLIGEEDMPLIPTMEDVSRYTLFETLFQAVGLASDDYSIDTSLASDNVDVAYYPDGNVRNALNKLAEAFNCTVFVTRDNIIKVLNNQTAGSSVKTFNDTDLVISSKMPQRFDEIYSDIDLKYIHHSIGELSSLLVIENLEIGASGSTYIDLKFTTAPVAFVSHIKITEVPHVSITSFSIGTWGMDITIANDIATTQTINLEVMGYPLELVENVVTVRNATTYTLLGDKARVLSLKNYLIQNSDDATSQANLILPIVSNIRAYVECTTRGDPSIELGDVITINDVTNKIINTEIVPIRFKYRYDGGLECEIKGMKKSARLSI